MQTDLNLRQIANRLKRIEAKLDQLLNQCPTSQQGLPANQSLSETTATCNDLDEFEQWWELVPAGFKQGKKPARKSYDAAIRNKLHHVPDPHKYLRERWDDEDEAWNRTDEGRTEFRKQEKARKFRQRNAKQYREQAEQQERQRRLELREGNVAAEVKPLSQTLNNLDK